MRNDTHSFCAFAMQEFSSVYETGLLVSNSLNWVCYSQFDKYDKGFELVKWINPSILFVKAVVAVVGLGNVIHLTEMAYISLQERC